MSRTGLLLATSAATLLLSAGAAAAAPALPTGGAVAAGSASIASSGASMTVSQSTPKAIIDWSSFSIGQGGSVQFNNGSGATLNRVTGTSGSAIDGLLSGTGSVYLINPNGVIVGKTGVVNVGGTFVASTLNTSDAGFLAGANLAFSGPSTAAVVNEGKVGSLGGDVVLVASTVSNNGSLSASNGTVGLLAGQSVLLRDQALDSGKFSVLVGGSSTSATNSGLIEAANAELRANGGNIYALAGNTGGVIRATGVNQGQGHVWLVAEGGSLDVAGTITARGPNGSGGTIETSGGDVKIGAASIDAGVGGTWLVDPYDLTIDSTAASTISSTLGAGTNVTEQTTASGASGFGNQNASGNGDIFVQAPISWSTGATLTLDAYRNIAITAPVTASGAGQVVLSTGSGGSGHLDFGLSQAGFAGGLSFTGAEGSGQSLTINGTPYTLIYSMTELAALNGGSGHDALATSLTPGSSFTDAVVKTFNGTLEGLGHVVNNLNIAAVGNINSGAAASNDLGLIGTIGASGAVADLGVVGGTVSIVSGGGMNRLGGVLGDLVGKNQGSISRVFATGAVMVGNQIKGGGDAGGLVGWNQGSISASFATGAVTSIPDAVDLGGLVGLSQGSISDSYATGSVSSGGGSYGTGGLVGASSGSVSRSFATGAVKGATTVGGLVGNASSGSIIDAYATGSVIGRESVGGLTGWASATITNAFASGWVNGGDPSTTGGFAGTVSGATFSNDDWNTQTSGQTIGGGTGTPIGVAGLTTTQLKGALPTGFSSATWGQIAVVSYPYLLSIYPTTPLVISGTVTGKGMKPGYAVSTIVNGVTNLGSASAGADLTFYFLEPGSAIPLGATAIVYLDGAPKKAVQVIEDLGAGSSLTGLYLTTGAGVLSTRDTTLSAAITDLAHGLGPATTAAGADILLGVSGSSLTLGADASILEIYPGGGGFDFDTDLNLGSTRLLGMVNYVGPITQSAGTITVGKLGGQSTGGLSLTSSTNQIGVVVGWSDGSGAISITNGAPLQIMGQVDAATWVTLTTTSGDLTLSSTVTSDTADVTLTSAGEVKESGAGTVHALNGALSATGVGGLMMKGANHVHSVALANSGGGTVNYTEVGNLSVSSASAGAGNNMTLVTIPDSSGHGTITLRGPVSANTLTLTSVAGIAEAGSGAITAAMLKGSAAGAVTLGGANMVGRLSGFTDTAGDFSLTDGETLTVTSAALNGTGHTVSLTTTSGDIAVNAEIDAATLNLTSQAGALTENNANGAIVAGTLNASAHTGITLASPNNNITTVGTDHTDSGPNTIVQ